MPSTSYPHHHTTAHAVGWTRAAHWIASVVCGLLLAFASASAAHAPTVSASHTLIDSHATGCATVVAESTNATDGIEVLDRLPMHDSGCPPDSSDLWLDPDDDDDCSPESLASRSSELSPEEILGLRRPSRAPGESLTPDGGTPASQFLIESVRRM